jgi:hypothetical protein
MAAVYHTGDAIGIAPFPAELLGRLLHEPWMRWAMCSHDAWYALPPAAPTELDVRVHSASFIAGASASSGKAGNPNRGHRHDGCSPVPATPAGQSHCPAGVALWSAKRFVHPGN